MSRLVPTLAAIVLLALPSAALAQQHKPFLTIPRAEHAIIQNETAYWRGEHVTLAVGECTRRSSAVVRCAVEITGTFFVGEGVQSIVEHADASLGATGRITVHPVIPH